MKIEQKRVNRKVQNGTVQFGESNAMRCNAKIELSGVESENSRVARGRRGEFVNK